MAERFPTEGLDWLLDLITGNRAAPSALFLGLFSSQSATTVPAATAVLATSTGVTEVSYVNYARAQLDPGEWAAAVDLSGGGGRRRFASQQALAALGAGSSAVTAHGFFVATALTGGVALFYSNFDEGDMSVSEADTPRVTPWIGLGE